MDEIDDEMLLLIDAVLSGEADRATIRRLERALKEDASARELLAVVSQMDVDMRHAFRTGAIGGTRTSVTPPPHSGLAEPRRRLPSGWVLSLTLAASLALAAFIATQIPSGQQADRDDRLATTAPAEAPAAEVRLASKPPAPVATVTSFEGRWEGQAYKVGETLREGDTLQLMEGKAEISIGYGAELVAEGPCSITFTACDSVRLDRGKVGVHVAEWAKGFTVLTDAMRVVDLGTTFTVSADGDAGAQASVLEGLIRVHPNSFSGTGPRGVLVTQGNAYIIDEFGQSHVLANKGSDRFSVSDFRKLEPYRPVTLFNSGVGFAEGDEDPHWRIVAGPGSVAYPQYAVVCRPDERYLANDPANSQWISIPNWTVAEKNSQFTFRTEFSLEGFKPETVQLFGRFLADNGVRAVRVNGNPAPVEAWVDNESYQVFDHNQFRFVNVTEGLKAGMNTIEIDVWNGVFKEPEDYRDLANPMAVRVEWYAFGRQTAKSS